MDLSTYQRAFAGAQTMTSGHKLLAELDDDTFWLAAFDKSTAFAEEARTQFRRGITSGDLEDLAWARLVLPALTDVGLYPITTRLLELAASNPQAEFVEPLVLQLTNADVIKRLERQIAVLPNQGKLLFMTHANDAAQALTTVGDIWAQSFRSSVKRLSEAKPAP